MKYLLALFVISLTACSDRDVVKLRIEAYNTDSNIVEIVGKNFKQTITLNDEGGGAAEFPVEPGMYQYFNGRHSTDIYLRNGCNLKMQYNTKKFYTSLAFFGRGSEANNILNQMGRNNRNLRSLLASGTEDFPQKVNKATETLQENIELIATPEIDKETRKALIPKLLSYN